MALAPSGAYFVKKLDAVGGISDSDLASMAFAEISSSAPVSPDRLRCGAMRAPDGSATAFGAIESSALAGLDEETIATADIVMPSFCAFLSSKLGDGEYFFSSGGSICAVKLQSCAAADFAAVESPQSPEEAKKALSKLLGFSGNPKCVELETFEVNGKNVKFNAKIDDGSGFKNISWSAPFSAFTTCDIRGANFLKNVKKAQRKRQLAILGAALVPIVFAGLFAYQINVIIKANEVANMEEELVIIEPEAKAIEARVERVASFANMTKLKPTPLELLAKINSARPDGITITSFARKGDSFELAGTANDLSKINEFVSKLKTIPLFANVVSKSDSSKTASKFSISGAVKK